MKKINFLIKLYKEGKLKLVDSSEEIKESYLQKSESNMISAKILLKNNRLEESIYLAYYSMYNSLIALLFKIGIKSENHSASIILLKNLFELDNSDIKFAKEERIDKQYYIDFKIEIQDVKDLIIKAENFNRIITGFLSKLENEKINMFRNKFKNILKEENEI